MQRERQEHLEKKASKGVVMLDINLSPELPNLKPIDEVANSIE